MVRTIYECFRVDIVKTKKRFIVEHCFLYTISFSFFRVEYLVLDESDKLFELGLIKQIDSVVKACSNPLIIRSLFNATLPDSVEELAHPIMHNAVRVIIGRK